jgi:hypothetical protein
MTPRRLALAIAPALLLQACGGERGGAGGQRESGGIPPEFELAAADPASTPAAQR